MKPQRGMRFRHTRILDTQAYDGKTRQIFQVTKISRAIVYYRPVYDYGTRQELGTPSCCPVPDFSKYAEPV